MRSENPETGRPGLHLSGPELAHQTASSCTLFQLGVNSAVNMERQTVSVMKACEMVGVSRRTLYNWMRANKVEYLRTAGGSRRIFVDTLWRESDGTKLPVDHTAA